MPGARGQARCPDTEDSSFSTALLETISQLNVFVALLTLYLNLVGLAVARAASITPTPDTTPPPNVSLEYKEAEPKEVQSL